MFILDTDHISILERAETRLGASLKLKVQFSSEEVAVTIISYEEQCRGWLDYLAKMKRVADQVVAYRRLLQQLRNYSKMNVLEFDEQAAIEFQSLKKQKIRVGTMDLKIASITLARQATLVTRNMQDFIKVPGLRLEDWTRA